MAKQINNFRIPNVTKTPQDKKVESNKLAKNKKSEFNELLQNEVGGKKPIHDGINVSSHAAKRFDERNIDFSGDEFLKVQGAIGRIKAKGGQDSLIVTENAAYIVDVKNNKIVTAVDKSSMGENVFTKIDSTIFV